MPATTPLRTELEYYATVKESLLTNHEGQYALVVDRDLLGTFTTEQEAYEAGLRRVGNRPFLIRRVRREEPRLQAPVLVVGPNLGTSP